MSGRPATAVLQNSKTKTGVNIPQFSVQKGHQGCTALDSWLHNMSALCQHVPSYTCTFSTFKLLRQHHVHSTEVFTKTV